MNKILYSKLSFEQILGLWSREYPHLSWYTRRKLFVVAEPVIIGLDFEKVHDDYRIYLNIIPLWLDDVAKLANCPIVYDELKNPKGRQFFMNLKLHDHYFDIAKECVKVQFGQLLGDKIKLSDIMNVINHFIRFKDYYWRNELTRAKTFELKMGIATYLGDERLIESLKNEIDRESKKWDKKHFVLLFHRNIEQWSEELDLQFGDRESFMEKVHANASAPRIANLNRSVIIKDQDFECQPYETPVWGWRRFLPKCWR